MGNDISGSRTDHDEVELLLPWFISGRLEPHEADRVELHLASCESCRAELALETELAGRLKPAESSAEIEAADAGWQRLMAAMANEASGSPSDTPLPAMGHDASKPWAARPLGRPWSRRLGRVGDPANLRRLVAVQFAALAVLGVALVTRPPAEPDFKALGAAPAAVRGNVVAKFRPDMVEAQLRRTLDAVDARIVDGPTTADAYVLQLPDIGRLQALREEPGVLMAEPIDRAPAE